MTDDLVKRLRIYAPYDPDQKEAADRIEELEAALLRIDKWLDAVIQVSRDRSIIIGAGDTKRHIAEAIAGETKNG